MAVTADTHAILWYLFGDKNLSEPARAAIDEAIRTGDFVFVASISLVEVIYLVEKKRLPEIALQRLKANLADGDSGVVLAPLEFDTATMIARIPRDSVPDMPDRIITATAMRLGLPLVTRDTRIRSAGIVETIW